MASDSDSLRFCSSGSKSRRRSVVDLAQPGDGAGGVKQVLGQRGLARVGVTGEDDVAEA